MEDGDILDFIPIMRGDIGIFRQHSRVRGSGVELLQDTSKLLHASTADAKRIIDQICPAGAPDMSKLVLGDDVIVLNEQARVALMDFVDNLRHACDSRVDISHGAHDEQVDISEFELASLIGADHHRRLMLLFGTPDKIIIRRVEATAQASLITFHTDTGSFKTMQVPINIEGPDYEGGRLVFATPGGFVMPRRLPGSYTIHRWYMPHGVTALHRGARYSLFLQTTGRLDSEGDR